MKKRPFLGLWNISGGHSFPFRLPPLLQTPTELIQFKKQSWPRRIFPKPSLPTCFHAPSRLQESLAFDDLVFPDLSLLYFEIEIPEPARDPGLTGYWTFSAFHSSESQSPHSASPSTRAAEKLGSSGCLWNWEPCPFSIFSPCQGIRWH